MAVTVPLVLSTEHVPETREKDVAPLPAPPVATRASGVPNCIEAGFERDSAGCADFAMVRVSVAVPLKFCSSTVAVTVYVPAFVGAHTDA